MDPEEYYIQKYIPLNSLGDVEKAMDEHRYYVAHDGTAEERAKAAENLYNAIDRFLRKMMESNAV